MGLSSFYLILLFLINIKKNSSVLILVIIIVFLFPINYLFHAIFDYCIVNPLDAGVGRGLYVVQKGITAWVEYNNGERVLHS